MLKLSYLAVSHNSSSPARWLYEVVQNIIVGMQPTAIAVSKNIQNDVRDVRDVRQIYISTATIQERTIR